MTASLFAGLSTKNGTIRSPRLRRVSDDAGDGDKNLHFSALGPEEGKDVYSTQLAI
jgi:hypothetical protein